LKGVLEIYKPFVRMPVQGLSALCEAFDTSPFSEAETAAGEEAGAMLAYQYQASLNAWFAVGMFALGVGVPRVVEFLDKKKKERERTVSGVTVVRKAEAPAAGVA
jgi:hypothetical protein